MTNSRYKYHNDNNSVNRFNSVLCTNYESQRAGDIEQSACLSCMKPQLKFLALQKGGRERPGKEIGRKEGRKQVKRKKRKAGKKKESSTENLGVGGKRTQNTQMAREPNKTR